MKSHYLKALIYCTVVSILIIVYTSFKDPLKTQPMISTGNFVQQLKANTTEQRPMKYILLWTSDNNVPFVDMGKGQSGFINRKCPYTNCFVTSNRYLLGNYTAFDVIAFAGPEITEDAMPTLKFLKNDLIGLPENRSAHQKYVFASIESSDYYRLCSMEYDGFFNWTWTYKLDSEVQWGYIVIRDKLNNVIGPKKNMNWLKSEDMDSVPERIKEKLKTKKKAAAWFVSNCNTHSNREGFVRKLKKELKKYKLVVDVYGRCGKLKCSHDNEERCDKIISKTYYFYLALENALSEDYVTEKILKALNNNAVPIVFGGANYSRFMPDGVYLNAIELGVEKLAEKMNELIQEPKKYAEYFRWINHYTYHKTTDSVETNEYCKFCELLNDEEATNRKTVYDNFREWWNTADACSINSLFPQELLRMSWY